MLEKATQRLGNWCLSRMFWLGVIAVISVGAQSAVPPASRVIDETLVRDPMRPVNWQVEAPRQTPQREFIRPTLQINSIIHANDRRSAIINGRRVAEGDTIAGARVARIEKRRVLMSAQGQRWYVQMGSGNNGSVIKRRAQ